MKTNPTHLTDQNGEISTQFFPEGITEITFFHPKHNSFPSQQLYALADQFLKLSQEDNTKIILFKTAGEKTFCAGASFDELLNLETQDQAEYFFGGFAAVINAMRTCKKIIIGQVQGKTIGGGLGLAAACDYCLATTHAEVRLSELSINLGPIVIAPAVERKIGLSAFTFLSLNPGKYLPAEWAKEKGLFQEIYQDLPSLKEAALSKAKQLCEFNTEALSALKDIFWSDTAHWDNLLAERAKISGNLLLNPNTKAQLRAFKERKKGER